MSNISMRTECGLLARAAKLTNHCNSGHGSQTTTTSSVEDQLLQHDAAGAGEDTVYNKLISNVSQDSRRSQSLPSCVHDNKQTQQHQEKCDFSDPAESPAAPMPCDCDTTTQIDINGGSESWFKTWPESRTNFLTKTSTMDSPPTINKQQCRCDETKNSETSNVRPAAIPLEQLLRSIPLAYSPITRQLHVLSPPVSLPHPDASKPNKQAEDGGEECLPRSGSPFSSLSSLSGGAELLCGPSNPSYDDDSSDTTSTSLVNDAHLNKTLLGAKLKQGAFTNFFSRSLFNWKLSKVGAEEEVSTYGAGTNSGTNSWKFFNRTTQGQVKEDTWSLDEACSSASSSCSSSSHAHMSRFPVLEASSGSLILEPRPAYLPAKSHEEEQRHRLQYQQMVQAAKKKEVKEAKLRKKQLQQQLKAEDQLAQAAKVWSSEVLPKWESMKGSRKTRDLWWQGLPPCVRGKVWRLAVGNELNLTPDLYEICVTRAQDRLRAAGSNTDHHEDKQHSDSLDKESSVELIQLDIARTFPLLCIFQEGGPYYDVLHSLLGAYVCYRPDLGYVQGMSFIAAVLILNLEAPDAFVCFANMLNRPCQRAFFHLNESAMHAYYACYNELFQENLPRLHKHFEQQGLTPDLYLLDWLYTMFSRSMPLDVACRVWDVYLRDGEEFLFRTALGVLHLYQEPLVGLDFLHGAQFLTKLPDDLPSGALFRSIEGIKTCVNKMKFSDVLSHQLELAKTSSETA